MSNIKILVIRLSSIGDIFHTFTVLPDIKLAYPNAQIDWLVDENFEKIAKLSPLIDNVLSIPLRKWKKNKLSWLFKLFNYKKNLLKQNYDYIIDTQGLIKSAFLARFLFNGPIYGLNKKSAKESLASLFYDYKYFVPQNNIAVFRLRGLIAAIFQLKTDLNKIDFKILAGNYSIDSSDGYILFLHGTSKNNKKWPLASWQFLGEWILKETNKDIILTYSNSQEFDFANCLIKALANPRIKLLPKLEFLALADLIQQADLVVGVDTGFTHLANLLGIATLAIYLASDPAYVGIVENARAQNFGGNNKTVMPIEIIDFIKNKQLLSINSLNKITQNLQE